MLLAVVATAQSPTDSQYPPNVAVLKFSWSKERIGWERDPFSPTLENYDDVRVRVRDERRLEQARRDNNRAEANKLERLARAERESAASKAQQPAPPRYVFRYKVLVKNGGTKSIKAIDWDYIFFARDTQTEIGRQQFTSEDSIGPGKTKELNVLIRKPPTRTISVMVLDKDERKTLSDQVVVVRVEYTDGSVWQQP
jgi:hypothetical protein